MHILLLKKYILLINRFKAWKKKKSGKKTCQQAAMKISLILQKEDREWSNQFNIHLQI